MASFWMYTSAELDFGWMRGCEGFSQLRRTYLSERTAEVDMRDLLAAHPRRTLEPRRASLFFIPVWEVSSFYLGECNGTTHFQRMHRAASALSASSHFTKRFPKGFDHFIITTGCIEANQRARERLGPLGVLLRHAVVGRDRAYSSFYMSSAVGRCVIETPYVANRFLMSARAPDSRQWLLSFHGSLDVCCEPGKSIRAVARALVGLANDTVVVDVRREQVQPYSQACGSPTPSLFPFSFFSLLPPPRLPPFSVPVRFFPLDPQLNPCHGRQRRRSGTVLKRSQCKTRSSVSFQLVTTRCSLSSHESTSVAPACEKPFKYHTAFYLSARGHAPSLRRS